MLVKIFGGAVYGINALTITIEVNILWGAKFIIVGLPDNAVKESQQRIDSALREIGLKIPGKRVIINMAPADVKKEGSSFDLPLAIGILAANDQLPNAQLDKYLIMGELSLDGSLQAVKGCKPARQRRHHQCAFFADNFQKSIDHRIRTAFHRTDGSQGAVQQQRIAGNDSHKLQGTLDFLFCYHGVPSFHASVATARQGTQLVPGILRGNAVSFTRVAEIFSKFTSGASIRMLFS